MCLAALSACGSDGKAADPGFDAVAEAVKAAAGTEGMAEQSADYIANMFKLDSGSYADALVMIANMGTSIDEYGVFHGSDAAQAEALHTAVQDYLQLRLDAWMPEYMPEEFPKGQLRLLRHPRRGRQDRRRRRLHRLLRRLTGN